MPSQSTHLHFQPDRLLLIRSTAKLTYTAAHSKHQCTNQHSSRQVDTRVSAVMCCHVISVNTPALSARLAVADKVNSKADADCSTQQTSVHNPAQQQVDWQVCSTTWDGNALQPKHECQSVCGSLHQLLGLCSEVCCISFLSGFMSPRLCTNSRCSPKFASALPYGISRLGRKCM